METLDMPITDRVIPQPDFMIIGAMKCATSTLHDQLALQDSFFMSSPKEPNFFSDDDIFSRGRHWYEGIFRGAPSGLLRGESSTHYTKLPTYPNTVERIKKWYPQMKFIYVIRHPVDRLISHYIHEWTQGVISADIDAAIQKHSELVDYSCYYMQVKPYIDTFGSSSVLLIFSERLRQNPLGELYRIFEFLEVNGKPVWQNKLKSNVSAERLRVCGWRDVLVKTPVLSYIRRRFISKRIRDRIKDFWRMKERPVPDRESSLYLENVFDHDLEQLGQLLGLRLNCKNFREVVVDVKDISWKQVL